MVGDEYLRYDREYRLSNGDRVVETARTFTPKGTRLEIESPDPSQVIRLDPMALESLSWQNPDIFPLDSQGDRSVVPAPESSIRSVDDAALDRGESVEITNEFAQVRVATVAAPSLDGLEIESPKMGHSILLDVEDLISLTAQTPARFSDFLEHPYGPDH